MRRVKPHKKVKGRPSLGEIETARAHLAAIVESSDDAIISKDLQGIVLTWNRAAERLFGYTAPEMIGQSITLLIPPDRKDEEPGILEQISRGKPVEHYETVRRRKDGSEVHISLTVSPIRDARRRVIGASKIARDITDRKRVEETLRQSEERYRRLNAELDERVNYRTAELVQSQERLRAVASELNLAEQKERKRLAGELHDNLGQFLALSRIKLGQAKHQPMDTVLARLIGEIQESIDKSIAYTRTLLSQLSPPVLHEFGLPMALEWLAQDMRQRNLHIVLDIKTNSCHVPEDRALLLFQCVRELLFNCIKHAQVTEARIVVEQIDESLYVRISDQGIGFDPAMTATSQARTNEAGQGFGLFSIRERMLSLGGKFDLQSSPGKGTVAVLVLPVPAAKDRMNASPPDDTGALHALQERMAVEPVDSANDTIRILIVDDNAMVRRGLASLLEEYAGVRVIGTGTNGEDAILLARELRPDVIVMDVTMPRLDGIEATRRIKQEHHNMAVIGLSVHNAEAVDTAIREAGAAVLLNKEAAVENLYRTILNVRRGRPNNTFDKILSNG